MHYKEDDLVNTANKDEWDEMADWVMVLDGQPIQDVFYTIVQEFDPHQEDICTSILELLDEGKLTIRDGRVYAV